jgi:hypothetical protein
LEIKSNILQQQRDEQGGRQWRAGNISVGSGRWWWRCGGDVLHGAVTRNSDDQCRRWWTLRIARDNGELGPDGGAVVLLLGAQRAGGAQGHPPRVHQHDRRAPRQKQQRMNREHDIDGAKAVPSS